MSTDNNIDRLVNFAKEKGIHPEEQQAIVEHIIGIPDQIFAALPEEYAGDILDTLKTKGHTTVINEATGQTDITDVTSMSHDESEETEIIYVDDEPYEVTPQKRQAYEFHDQEMKMGWLKASFHLAIILEADLYKVAGYSNQEEYAKYHLGESKRNMTRKARRGRELLSVLPGGTSMSQLMAGDYNEYLENIAEIGPTKFSESIKFDDDEFDLQQFVENGQGQLPSGETINVEDIKAQTTK